MNTAKILKVWHYAGLAVGAASFLAQELFPLVSTGTTPKALAIVTGLGTVSVATSFAMNKIANDKVVQAIINDPSSPTPQGFGIPSPAIGCMVPHIAAAIGEGQVATAAAMAAAKNVSEFAAQLKESAVQAGEVKS